MILHPTPYRIAAERERRSTHRLIAYGCFALAALLLLWGACA